VAAPVFRGDALSLQLEIKAKTHDYARTGGGLSPRSV